MCVIPWAADWRSALDGKLVITAQYQSSVLAPNKYSNSVVLGQKADVMTSPKTNQAQVTQVHNRGYKNSQGS